MEDIEEIKVEWNCPVLRNNKTLTNTEENIEWKNNKGKRQYNIKTSSK